MKIAYFTTLAPCGEGESFVLNEIRELSKQNDITVLPVRKKYEYCGKELRVKNITPHRDAGAFASACGAFVHHPVRAFMACSDMFFCAGSVKNAFKNLFFFTKALALARFMEKEGFEFIHAHWLATTSSVAYIASRVSGVPFGITGHRFDVYAENALKKKARAARFIRLIDNKEYRRVLSRVEKQDAEKIKMIHLGVDIPRLRRPDDVSGRAQCVFCTPASLIPVKGHSVLIRAAAILKKEGMDDIRFVFYGDGELKDELIKQIESEKLGGMIEIKAPIENRELLRLYDSGAFFGVILPSVELSYSEHEGIPVSLMEAMAHSVPVISTESGGIPELLHSVEGALVPPGNSQALALAIMRLRSGRYVYETAVTRGYEAVCADFSNETNTARLFSLFEKKSGERV